MRRCTTRSPTLTRPLAAQLVTFVRLDLSDVSFASLWTGRDAVLSRTDAPEAPSVAPWQRTRDVCYPRSIRFIVLSPDAAIAKTIAIICNWGLAVCASDAIKVWLHIG